MKNKKVCIIGSAPSKADAPYGDTSYDIWAISGAAFSESLGDDKKPNEEENGWNCVHRVDAFFEMHKPDRYSDKVDKLAACGKPVFMQKEDTRIPTSCVYPIDGVSERVGDDFSSTIAYMMALAIYRGYTEIRLYGVIMGHKSEYMRQRPGVKYYIGIARALGITVWAPDETQLVKPLYRYGYDDHDVVCGVINQRKQTIEDDIKNQTKLIEAAQATLWQLKGALITCDNLEADIKGGLA